MVLSKHKALRGPAFFLATGKNDIIFPSFSLWSVLQKSIYITLQTDLLLKSKQRWKVHTYEKRNAHNHESSHKN